MPDRAEQPESPSQYWDSIGQEWQRRRPQTLWRRYCDQLHISLLRRWLGDQERPDVLKTDLFDEVAGEGLVGYLAQHANSVTGIDVSPVIVEQAGAKHPSLKALVADVCHLPFADGSFDLIVSDSTLDHFASPDQIGVSLGELARTLRPSGQLLLTMDNPANPLIWLRNGRLGPMLRRAGIVPYYVGATLRPKALVRAVRDAGLEVRETTAIMHCPRVLAVALSERLGRRGPDRHEAFLKWLHSFECLERLPTKYLTGRFVAIRAVKPLSPQLRRGVSGGSMP
jgi:SAM-dependent methyltransferase